MEKREHVLRVDKQRVFLTSCVSKTLGGESELSWVRKTFGDFFCFSFFFFLPPLGKRILVMVA